MAVAEATRNIIASGGNPLAITDCLNYGSPDKPEGFWELSTSADGIAAACRMLETPVISGNVSLYNETSQQSVYPTPVIGMVGLIDSLDHVTTQDFKEPDDLVYVVGETYNDFNGSELQKMTLGRIEGELMGIDLTLEKDHQQKVLQGIRKGWIASAHDCSEGGLGVALMEACFGKELGVHLETKLNVSQLFAETPSRFVLSVPSKNREAFEELMDGSATYLGKTCRESTLHIKCQDGDITLDIQEAKKVWEDGIPCLMK